MILTGFANVLLYPALYLLVLLAPFFRLGRLGRAGILRDLLVTPVRPATIAKALYWESFRQWAVPSLILLYAFTIPLLFFALAGSGFWSTEAPGRIYGSMQKAFFGYFGLGFVLRLLPWFAPYLDSGPPYSFSPLLPIPGWFMIAFVFFLKPLLDHWMNLAISWRFCVRCGSLGNGLALSIAVNCLLFLGFTTLCAILLVVFGGEPMMELFIFTAVPWLLLKPWFAWRCYRRFIHEWPLCLDGGG